MGMHRVGEDLAEGNRDRTAGSLPLCVTPNQPGSSHSSCGLHGSRCGVLSTNTSFALISNLLIILRLSLGGVQRPREWQAMHNMFCRLEGEHSL